MRSNRRIDRLRAERERLTIRSLRTEQRHRYQANLLELTRDAFFTWDMSGKVLYWNRGAEALNGFDRAAAIGKVVHTLLNTQFVVPLEQIVDRLHQHDSWEGQFARRRADGAPRIVSCRLTLQRDAAGRASMVLETNNDITERVRLEDALEQARSDLVRMNRVLVLGELTASIAHMACPPTRSRVSPKHFYCRIHRTQAADTLSTPRGQNCSRHRSLRQKTMCAVQRVAASCTTQARIIASALMGVGREIGL
ncbi:PAS domain S-box protein [Paraburkholderia sp. CI3]|uniref:PAS domain S-box protein n=1 Tax=Paraburkholderia sp. CI3 TaxID=2991060 RepID=UPI003D204F6E